MFVIFDLLDRNIHVLITFNYDVFSDLEVSSCVLLTNDLSRLTSATHYKDLCKVSNNVDVSRHKMCQNMSAVEHSL